MKKKMDGVRFGLWRALGKDFIRVGKLAFPPLWVGSPERTDSSQGAGSRESEDFRQELLPV